MALNERIWVACGTCSGYRYVLDDEGDVSDCPACRLNPGHDEAAEARLGELAGELPRIVRFWADLATDQPHLPLAWLLQEGHVASSRDTLDALRALLLTGDGG